MSNNPNTPKLDKPCPHCKGRGEVDGSTVDAIQPKDCPTCHNTGTIESQAEKLKALVTPVEYGTQVPATPPNNCSGHEDTTVTSQDSNPPKIDTAKNEDELRLPTTISGISEATLKDSFTVVDELGRLLEGVWLDGAQLAGGAYLGKKTIRVADAKAALLARESRLVAEVEARYSSLVYALEERADKDSNLYSYEIQELLAALKTQEQDNQ